MKKLSFKVRNNTLYIKEYKHIKKTNIENTVSKTNIIDVDNMYFSSEYIIKNKKLMTNFMKDLIQNNNIDKIEVENMYFSKLILRLLPRTINLKEYIIDSEEELDFDNFYYLEKLNISEIYLYSLFDFMFEKLNAKNKKVITKEEILCLSKFREENGMTTYSNIVYSKDLVISYKLNKEELNELDSFFGVNLKLKNIHLAYYDNEILSKIFHVIKKYHKKDINIKIYYNSNESIVPFIDKLKEDNKEIIKKNKINIKVHYNKKYKKRYFVKQLNINIIKGALLFIIFTCSIILIHTHYKWTNSQKNAEDITKKINAKKESILGIVDYDKLANQEKDSTYIDNYFKKFNKVFSELKKINKDTVAWIKVNNTKIDYPVVQSSDNEYYLNRDFYKKSNVYGWVFMDFRNKTSILDQNTIIYGHQDRHGLMFTTLNEALKPSWYKNSDNQIIELNTPNKLYKFKIFSVYITDPVTDYLVTNFNDKDRYTNFLNNLVKKSIYNFGVNVDKDDKILTLSTCYDGPNKRVVVHAKLIN